MADKNEALLQRIRDRYKYASDQWQEARDERTTDLRFILGDPWTEDDRKARREAGRPTISHDELGQYLNAAINGVRQNRRGIKIGPAKAGADEQTAAQQEDLVRTIEKNSRAQGVYCQAFQQMVEGGYGFFRVSRKYTDDDSFDQEIVLKGIPNPDSVLVDPDCQEPDWSDQRFCFVLEPMPRDEFKRRWPGAQVQDFSNEDMRVAPDWIKEDSVLVAEYWELETAESYTLYQRADGSSSRTKPEGQRVVRTRTVEVKKLVQRFTNGIEILEETEQPGDVIPIVPMIGLERWVDEGSGPKRKINSMIRLARDPQMSLAFLSSQQMEEAGLSPKVPYVGYKGQFESDQEAWDSITKIPHAYLQVDALVDGASGQVLPLPQRVPFTPNFQEYEIAKDSARRAIQAAMGISPLPTAAQRNNEKSGVALEKITDAQNLGSYHFIDSFDRALCYAGRVILAWIPVTYDTEREISLRKADDTHKVVTINTREPYFDQHSGEMTQFDTAQGEHYPDVSTGPSHQSQMEDAAEFLDQLIGNMPNLPVAPPQAAKLLSLAIKMRNLGPLGDQMAEIISPQDQTGQQAMALAQQAQMQNQQMQEAIGKLQTELQQLQLERAGKVIDNQARMQIERMKIEAGLAEAEIATKAQVASERNEFVSDLWAQMHGQAHEAALQSDQQAHEQQMAAAEQQHEQALAQQQAAVEQQQQQQQGEQQAALQSDQQAHEQQMTGQQQQHEQKMASQQRQMQALARPKAPKPKSSQQQ